MNKVRCTVCRGARQVMKLGGVIGSCNLCKGEGEINACDIPVKPKVAETVIAADIVQQVANVTPISQDIEPLEVPQGVDVKVDGKRAIYKRKTVGK